MYVDEELKNMANSWTRPSNKTCPACGGPKSPNKKVCYKCAQRKY